MNLAPLLALPVLLPLLGAALTLVLRRSPRAQVGISLVVLLSVLAVAVTLMWGTHDQGPVVLWLGAWSEPLGIALVADRLAALMLLVSSFVMVTVLVFAIGQGVADGDEDSPLAIYSRTERGCHPPRRREDRRAGAGASELIAPPPAARRRCRSHAWSSAPRPRRCR